MIKSPCSVAVARYDDTAPPHWRVIHGMEKEGPLSDRIWVLCLPIRSSAAISGRRADSTRGPGDCLVLAGDDVAILGIVGSENRANA